KSSAGFSALPVSRLPAGFLPPGRPLIERPRVTRVLRVDSRAVPSRCTRPGGYCASKVIITELVFSSRVTVCNSPLQAPPAVLAGATCPARAAGPARAVFPARADGPACDPGHARYAVESRECASAPDSEPHAPPSPHEDPATPATPESRSAQGLGKARGWAA